MTDNTAAIAAWVAAVATTLAVIVYAIQAWFNHKQVKISQHQVSTSQEQLWTSRDQVHTSQEQIYVMYRPLLFPSGSETLVESSQEAISIRNAGPGTALNIRGVVFGHKPPHQLDEDSCLKKLWFANPLPPGDPPVNALNLQNKTKFRGDCLIGNQHREYAFYAPEPTLYDRNKGIVPILQRLTLTYHDVFGLKHASIFDLTYPQSWKFVAFLANIPKDIDELEHEIELG